MLLTEKDRDVLFGTPLFSGFDSDERLRASIRLPAKVALFSANETIIEAGTQFAAIGILTDGEAAVIRSGERRRVIHKTLSAGDIFGVSSLFDAADPFPTTIRATDDCRIVFISEQEIGDLLETFPKIAKNYIKLLTQKIRFLNHRLDTFAGRSAEERVAEHLLSEIGADGTLGTTKSALASMLGLGRASLYRILDLFENSGFIRTSRDRIEIQDAESLKTFIKNRKET